MKIVLLRHGKPAMENWKERLEKIDKLEKAPKFLSVEQLQQWVVKYNSADIDRNDLPSEQSVSLASECDVTFSSDFPRSISSCQRLMKGVFVKDIIFQEAGLPIPSCKFLPLSLPISLWLLILRSAWFLGYSSNTESYRQAVDRAKEAAMKLQDSAQNNSSVILVGHGIMNQLIAKQLTLLDWKNTRNMRDKHYWGFKVFEK